MSWISFSGTTSTSKFINVEHIPALPTWERRIEALKISGRDGDLTYSNDDYETATLTIDMAVTSLTLRDTISAWLIGAGDLILSSMPTKLLKARVVGAPIWAPAGPAFRRFSVEFIVQPFWREVTPTVHTLAASSLTNLITGGNFPDATGWDSVDGDITVSGNKLSLAGTGTGASPYVYTVIGATTAGHKYYVRVNVRAGNSVCQAIQMYLGDEYSTIVTAPEMNVWYYLGAIITASSTYPNAVFYQNYADAATANGKYMEMQYALAIDLTATFGAGNEPTATAMNATLLTYFPGTSWFDGTFYVPQIITNPGTRLSPPRITVTGTGGLSVNGTVVTITVTGVVIDSEIEECYIGATNKNATVTGGFPHLDPGANTVMLGAGITQAVIEGMYRWY